MLFLGQSWFPACTISWMFLFTGICQSTASASPVCLPIRLWPPKHLWGAAWLGMGAAVCLTPSCGSVVYWGPRQRCNSWKEDKKIAAPATWMGCPWWFIDEPEIMLRIGRSFQLSTCTCPSVRIGCILFAIYLCASERVLAWCPRWW